jgi:hypothetical protein
VVALRARAADTNRAEVRTPTAAVRASVLARPARFGLRVAVRRRAAVEKEEVAAEEVPPPATNLRPVTTTPVAAVRAAR